MSLVKKIKKNDVMGKTAQFCLIEFRSYLFIFYGVSTVAHFKNGIYLEQREQYQFRIATALFDILFALYRKIATCGLQNPCGETASKVKSKQIRY